MRRRVSSDCVATSSPPMSARPAVGGKKPVRMRMIVVFPEPLGPRSPMISPFSTLKETWFTARVAPKYLVRSWTSIIYSLQLAPRDIALRHGSCQLTDRTSARFPLEQRRGPYDERVR